MQGIAQVQYLHPPTRASARRLRRKVTIPVALLSMQELNAIRLREKISLALLGQAIDVTAGHLSRVFRGLRELPLGKRLLLQAILMSYAMLTTPPVMPATSTSTPSMATDAVAITSPVVPARPISGAANHPGQVTTEELQKLANHFNNRRI